MQIDVKNFYMDNYVQAKSPIELKQAVINFIETSVIQSNGILDYSDFFREFKSLGSIIVSL